MSLDTEKKYTCFYRRPGEDALHCHRLSVAELIDLVRTSELSEDDYAIIDGELTKAFGEAADLDSLSRIPESSDPHQSFFNDAIKGLDDKFDSIRVINMEGFPASQVDMGWIKDKINELVANKQIQSEKDIQDFIFSRIQRAKYVGLRYCQNVMFDKEDAGYYEIELRTKDNRGWYTYEFDLYLHLRERLPGSCPTELTTTLSMLEYLVLEDEKKVKYHQGMFEHSEKALEKYKREHPEAA